MPSVPKSVRNPRKLAAAEGKALEERAAEALDDLWQLIAEVVGMEDAGHVTRRKKDATLGYAVEASDGDYPVNFPIVHECKFRGELPKTPMKWLEQAKRYDPTRIPMVIASDGGPDRDHVWMLLKDALSLWREGWEAAGEAIAVVEKLREAAVPVVSSLSFVMAEGGAMSPSQEEISRFVEVFGGGSVSRHPSPGSAETPQ